MDDIQNIKDRLSIEDLVSQYCTVTKKGRSFVCICPFHNDTKPSMNVNPEKGIAYCFACQTGGDIFTFYQKIEGVDFAQSVQDLAEKAGVKLSKAPKPVNKEQKQHRNSVKDCLAQAATYFVEQRKASSTVNVYLTQRMLSEAIIDQWQLGYSADSSSGLYQHLLKQGFAKQAIVDAGLAIEIDMDSGKMRDRFRHRLMFPISDHQGNVVAFGGRTMGDDQAKYINSPEGHLYHKSNILYGYHMARDAMRSSGSAIIVEGYTDVLACHQVGIANVVGTCGTALTDQHVKLLKRLCDTVVLAFDSDDAGQQAAKRGYDLCSRLGLTVRQLHFAQKDPADMLLEGEDALNNLLVQEHPLYLDAQFAKLQGFDMNNIEVKQNVLGGLLPLIQALPSSVQQQHYLQQLATLLLTTELALQQDFAKVQATAVAQQRIAAPNRGKVDLAPVHKEDEITKTEIALTLLCFYPSARQALTEFQFKNNDFNDVTFNLLNTKIDQKITQLDLPADHQERFSIIELYLEHYGMLEWNDELAKKEIAKHIEACSREYIRTEQQLITAQLLEAQQAGDSVKVKELQQAFMELSVLS